MAWGAPRARRKKGRGGPLVFLAALLIGSAVLRVALEAPPALARSSADRPAKMDTEPAGATKADLQRTLSALQAREARLQSREAALAERLKALEVAERAIDTRMTALEAAEESLRQTLALAEVAAEDDLTALTDMYQRMKPKDAAALFEEMDPEFAAGFLARMPAEAAAGILAGLSPTTAYTVSVVLAGRNASVPRN